MRNFKNLKLLSRAIAVLFLLIQFSSVAWAQEDATPISAPAPVGVDPVVLQNSYLKDRNGDGVLKIAAFGDSITRGIGDFLAPGDTDFNPAIPLVGEAGYPLRLESLAMVNVENLGNPGERLSTAGLRRFAATIPKGAYDVVIVSGGSNDARDFVTRGDFFRSVQAIINIGGAVGAKVVLATTPPVCCGHRAQKPFIDIYDATFRTLAFINNLPLADIYQGYANTCQVNNCALLHLPEGLHPNINGYDVMGEIVLGALLKIDVLSLGGPQELEAALNLTTGSVRVLPTPVATPVVSAP